ncbi:MAG: MarR family transcriptional regulator [Rhizomicrobium sp.]
MRGLGERKSQREFIVRIMSVAKAYRHFANTELENSHLSHSTALVVTLLSHKNGNCSQKYLADQLDMTPASLVPLLNQIEKSGLIIRRIDPDDKRINNIELTAKGDLLAKDAQHVLDAVRNKMFDGIASSDVDAAVRVVTALQAALSSQKTHQK